MTAPQRRRPLLAGAAVIFFFVPLSGCAVTSNLPAFNTVRDEVNSITGQVVAVMPVTGPVTPLGEDTFGCGGTGVPEAGNGVSYSNHLVVVQSDDFDGAAFIEALPTVLGDGFVVQESGVAVDFPSVEFAKPGSALALIEVSTGDLDGERYIDVYAYGVCSQEPATPSR